MSRDFKEVSNVTLSQAQVPSKATNVTLQIVRDSVNY